jgi:hypothetical protein
MENIIVFMTNHIFTEIGFVLFDFHRSPRSRQAKDITLATLKQVPPSPVQFLSTSHVLGQNPHCL